MMGLFSKMHKIAFGIWALTGAALYYANTAVFQEQQTQISWARNYVQSYKWDENWDFRSSQNSTHPMQVNSEKNSDYVINDRSSQATTTAWRHLILIRHGQYNLRGETDKQCYLTALGRYQAENTGKRLKELNLPYTSMVKSTMARAQETGKIISKYLPNLPCENCDLLREGAPISPEPPIKDWKHEPYDAARIEAAFREYFHRADPKQTQDSYTILVCHANVIRYFVCRALQFPPEAWLRISLNHASITWLSITPNGRVILSSLGDSGHMPPSMITSE